MPLTSHRLARSPSRDREHEKFNGSAFPTAAKLSTLLEREETPKRGTRSNLAALVSPSPLYPVLRTPRSTAGITPSFEEAHPSKVQRSTAKQPDTGLLFGFVDMNARNAKHDGTPTKSNCAAPSDFEFSFSRPRPGLGLEARRMMDELQGEAAQIKKRLEAERSIDTAENGEQGSSGLIGVGGRKFATAKGKSGRFSDVHKAEFRKMDSIAGHPSAFRTQPGRFTPATTPLKRTKSQAKLDDNQDGSAKPMSFRGNGDGEDGHLADTSRAKRVRTSTDEDTSGTSQKIPTKARDIGPPTTPSIPRSRSGFSKASLAQSASFKRSASIHTPTASSKSLKHVPITGLGPVLRGQESAAARPTLHNQISIHPVSTSSAKSSPNKDLPLLPPTSTPGSARTTTTKRVAFTSDTNFNLEANQVTPKSRVPAAISYPSLPSLPPPSGAKASQLHGPGVFTFRTDKKLEFGSGVGASTIRQVMPSGNDYGSVRADSGIRLLGVPHGIQNEKKRCHDEMSSDDEPASKKSRSATHQTPTLHQRTKDKLRTRSKIPRTNNNGGKRKGVLSLSRLNMLATPKKRKGPDDGVEGSGQKAKSFWRI